MAFYGGSNTGNSAEYVLPSAIRIGNGVSHFSLISFSNFVEKLGEGVRGIESQYSALLSVKFCIYLIVPFNENLANLVKQ